MMQKIQDTARALWKDEKGAALIEYSLLIGFIVATVVLAVIAVGGWVSGRWTTLRGALGV